MCLPKENNRSRIILTTREFEVANYVGPDTKPHQMDLLSDVESWELLQLKVFGNNFSPPDVKETGEKIVRNCRGLPLAVTIVGGLLSTSKDNLDFWKEVSKNTSSVLNDKDHLSSILLVSYNHLPSHLKPCFLYFGCFPEDTEIRASTIIRLLVAEGFLKPIQNTTPEDAARLYLTSLVHRNLIFIGQYESKERVKSYNIHDLLRDLCVRKAIEENLFCVKSKGVRNNPAIQRRVIVHTSYHVGDVLGSTEQMSLARSFVCIGPASRAILSPVFFSLKLLKILNILGIEFSIFPEEVLQLVNLRLLAFTCRSFEKADMTRLCDLETFECKVELFMDSSVRDLWTIGSLRHAKFRENGVLFYYDRVLENMQTLCNVTIGNNDQLEKLPNLRKLEMECSFYDDSNNFATLRKLETLKCWGYWNWRDSGKPCLSVFTFPPSLKKLVLCKCIIPEGFMTTIGELPNLQVLKLRECSFTDSEWEVNEGEFQQLQFLLLENLDLVSWIVEGDYFRRLHCLIIRSCDELERIPVGVGDSPMLEMIEIDDASPSATESAKELVEEQEQFGNDTLRLRLL